MSKFSILFIIYLGSFCFLSIDAVEITKFSYFIKDDIDFNGDISNIKNGDSSNNIEFSKIEKYPIIGILEQELFPNDDDDDDNKSSNKKNSNTKYIAASYVKYVESSGARVIPICVNQSEEYYEDILSKINGVLFPGGSVLFNNKNGFADAGMHIYNIAKKMNDNGIYMPIWGTCLGFELLPFLTANRSDPRVNCSSNSQALHLEFKPGYETSRLFGKAPDFIINILKTENVTSNFHKFCFTEDSMKKYNLDKEWRTLSTNKDWNGLEFISSIEHIKYPFYGIQFHPEKNMFEWVKNRNISHTGNAILASQYFANFFINEARKNNNHFKNETEEQLSLIYNYKPYYTGRNGSSFEQSYFFPLQSNGSLDNNNFLISTKILLILVLGMMKVF